MPDALYRLTDDFAPATAARWRELVAADLAGRPWTELVSTSRAGLDIQPLYTAEDWAAAGDPTGRPGAAPHTRGGCDPRGEPTWDVRPEYTHPEPAVANAQILQDLSRGATSVLLKLDPAGVEGVAVRSVDDLDRVLAGVDLALVPLALESGPRFRPVSALLREIRRRRDLADDKALGAHQADPIGSWCVGGNLPVGLAELLDDMAALAAETASGSRGVRAVSAKSCPFHNAGADEARELAFTLAEALAYLRAMDARGLGIDAAAAQIQFCFAVTGEIFGEIAKLRAARTLWGRIVAACGGGPSAQRMRLHARTSARMMTRHDPWVNMLRVTTATFAAVTGGADAVTVAPFDAAINVPDGFSRRIARNVQVILQEESHLGHVVDPAGGCWHLERRTAELAARAWALFQDVERRGGLVAGLRDGWVQTSIAEVQRARERDVARRLEPVTGISEFPALDETPVGRTRPAPPPGGTPAGLRLAGEDGAAHDPIDPLALHRTAEPFEVLRDA
ncbi:methylmalonyl-CoA mutase subunit beta, partial [bacterium]|nr:methylmalonyl-CoA mutase subunit beta [bacterium]